MIRNLKKLQAASHCTGFAGQDDLLYQITNEVNCHIEVPIEHNRAVHTSECCDHRLQYLLSLDDNVRPQHIHMAIKQRYPDDFQCELDSLIPKSSCPAHEKETMFDDMKQKLRNFYQDRPEEASMAPCLCHPHADKCKLFSNEVDGNDVGCDTSDDEEQLTLLGVGLPCQDETTFNNKKEGRLGKQRPTHLMVQEEFRHLKPILGVVECAAGWKPSELAEDNKETHTTEYCKFEADKYGDAYHRDRCLAWSWDHSRAIRFI